MSGRLDGKVCVVTGTGGGIGRAIAQLFAREGAEVVGCDIDELAGAETVRMVEEQGGVMVSLQPCDLTQADRCADLVKIALDRFGRIDVLCNSAAKAYFNWIEDISHAEWTRNLDEELTLVFLLTQAAWPSLRQSKGVVVNLASVTAWATFPAMAALAHSTAKAGVVAMTRHLAMEGAADGIRANSVSPGIIETSQTKAQLADQDWTGRMLERCLLKRVGQPGEIANVALFLASDESSYVNGTDIHADGGSLA
ncbi:SDR family oxidoreductase [Polymorphobacter sp. PAMC 29334]|uniref:SDR family NAD(P)-dependent oxidoreductase n=1 Tax=Polymorphobacter sp. PAMC 29334 TaxID=2862331 RepID=UPI001C66C98F|nr:SDR family oxidoreductase [Polymorphobacter sp. PAMC 29334]QYE36353.1 SDR family oxidoreductase [Polymorphobacter sp. PAMC 29334]